MTEPRINPHLVTKPIQLLAVWMASLVLLYGASLTGAELLRTPIWLAGFLSISAVLYVPVFLGLLFLLLTKFRPQLQEDIYYADWLAQQQKIFGHFHPANLERRPETQTPLDNAAEFERERIARYERQQGLFLIHTWRPSTQPGQVADIVIRLHQHGDGPLTRGAVDRVEYALGPRFFDAPVVRTNRTEYFRLEVSAYDSMLCIAHVHLNDGSTLILDRYIDFEKFG